MGYINTVIVSSVSLGVLALAVGVGRLSKHCRQIISLLLILTVVLPFLSAIHKSLPSLGDSFDFGQSGVENGEAEAYAEIVDKCVEKLEEKTANAVSAKLGVNIKRSDVDIGVDSSDRENIVITFVGISADCDEKTKEKISAYLKELLLCDNVSVTGGKTSVEAEN